MIIAYLIVFILSAPNGCLQYFTGNGGQVTSFNGGLTGDTGEMLVDQQYSACVRQEAGEYQFLFYILKHFITVPYTFFYISLHFFTFLYICLF